MANRDVARPVPVIGSVRREGQVEGSGQQRVSVHQ